MFKNRSGLYIFARIVPVVQWIELLIPVQLMGVRIPSGTQKNPLADARGFFYEAKAPAASIALSFLIP